MSSPLYGHHVDGASRYCHDSLGRVAAGLAGLGVRPPASGDGAVAEFVGGFLGGGEDGDRAAWVLVAGADVRGFVGATFVELTPDDWRHTFMPPRFVSITANSCPWSPAGTSPDGVVVRTATASDVDALRGRQPLSARFWTRLGFRPHLHTDGLWI
jgi:hypothetical protein